MNFDYLIIGGGSAGCVLANRLSANPNTKVCLIEAGPTDKNLLVKMPFGIAFLMNSKKRNWRYWTKPQDKLNKRKIYIPRGKTLGGSSSINAMIYTRGHPNDYDHWESLGNNGWGWKDLLPIFRRSQNQERGEDDFHGVGGPLNVADLKYRHQVSAKFIEAAIQAGFPYNNDFNGKTQEGVGFFQVTQKNGCRFSAANAYLYPALNRPNLIVYTNSLVNKLILNNKKVIGAEVDINGEIKRIEAWETILSAGSINSPQILLLSGIGPKNELMKHKINIEHEIPGVGQNLHDHPDVLIVNRSPYHDTLSYSPLNLISSIKAIYNFLTNNSGQFTSNIAESVGFIKSHQDESIPNLQLHLTPTLLDNHGLNRRLSFGFGFSAHVCFLHPLSRGNITLKDVNPKSSPIIDPKFLSHPKDMEVMLSAVKIVRNIIKQQALDKRRGVEIFPGNNVQSDDEIRSFLRRKCDNIYHPVGTCKMGIDDMAVVSPDSLRIHGLDNIRVVDASIMPTIPGGNTNAPTVVIAEKIADHILGTS